MIYKVWDMRIGRLLDISFDCEREVKAYIDLINVAEKKKKDDLIIMPVAVTLSKESQKPSCE